MPQGSKTNSAIRLPFLRIGRDGAAERPQFADIMATDGTTVQRLVAADRQIFVQKFNNSELAGELIDHIEQGLDRGHALVGYSLLDNARAVCVRSTDDDGKPGWLAYREESRISQEIIKSVKDNPRMRLVAGATTHAAFRTFEIHVALEERGETSSEVSLLDAVDDVSFHATRRTDNSFEFVRLGRDLIVPDKDHREGPHRRHLCIPFAAELYGSLQANEDVTFWLRVDFCEEFINLPAKWRQIYLQLRPR